MENNYPIPPKTDRNQDLIKDYQSGISILDLTIKYRITSARVFQILKTNKIKTHKKLQQPQQAIQASPSS